MESTTQRFASLDGLRGVAATVVVIFHIVISDRHAGAVYQLDHPEHLSWIDHALNYTPLRIVWAGSEAVVVFYVLSGLVLALPFARGRSQPWTTFYPRRLLRLYLPAIASLVFAWFTTLLIARHAIPGGSPWLNAHAAEPTGLLQVALGSSLMNGWGGLNTSLWSLRFEVAFSMLLPLFLFAAVKLPRLVALKAVAVTVVMVAWPLVGLWYPDAVYLAVFGFGVLMAFHLPTLGRWATAIPAAGWWLLTAAAVLLLTNSWIVAGFDLTSRLRAVWVAPAAVGAALLVFAAAFWPPAVRWLERPAIHWLGMISFSLYLVQEPVVVGLAFATHDQLPLWVMLPLGLGLALVVGWAFYRLVERPAHRVARSYAAQRPAVSAAAQPAPTA